MFVIGKFRCGRSGYRPFSIMEAYLIMDGRSILAPSALFCPETVPKIAVGPMLS
jgi:hypothetical protein